MYYISYLYPRLQRLAVLVLEHVGDVPEVELAARHHGADELPVVGAQPLHGLVQPLGEEQRLVADHFHCYRYTYWS